MSFHLLSPIFCMARALERKGNADVGIYSDRIFPWVIDKLMDRPVMSEQRRQVLEPVKGDVLEIGFGTGLNIPFYSNAVDRLTVVDPNAGMHRRAAKRISQCPLSIESVKLRADGALPLDENRFDTVVSTWTMCSIPDLSRALVEISRVLKPGGRLVFVEHGLSPDKPVASWQNRLNPIHQWLGDGCHLNRDIAQYISESPLTLEKCDQFYMRETPRFAGWLYRGTATK